MKHRESCKLKGLYMLVMIKLDSVSYILWVKILLIEGKFINYVGGGKWQKKREKNKRKDGQFWFHGLWTSTASEDRWGGRSDRKASEFRAAPMTWQMETISMNSSDLFHSGKKKKINMLKVVFIESSYYMWKWAQTNLEWTHFESKEAN